jgi:MFS family permease
MLKLQLSYAFLHSADTMKTIGPLAAKEIGASDTLAPFTIGTFLIGAAVSSVPSGKLFKAYGRYWGFAFGCLCQLAGSAVGSFAMIVDSLVLLFIGCFCVGLGQGLGQFYRFAAVEVASEKNSSKAVTYVLTGGVLAAFLGPMTANFTKNIVSHDYFGSFLSMGLIGLMNWGVVALVNFPSNKATGQVMLRLRKSRPIGEIISQPIFIISCTIATIAHTVMVSQEFLST